MNGRELAGEIIPLDPLNKSHVQAVFSLHSRLLSDSPISKLGAAFMKGFYYPCLVRDGSILCDLYWLDGRAVGFASYTERPFSFMREGQRRHFFLLIFLLCGIVLMRPSRLRVIWEVSRGAGKRSRCENEEAMGELLSFGVAPEYAPWKDPAAGKRIPNLLFERVIAYFEAKRFSNLQMVIRRDNTASLLFFNQYGARVQNGVVAGERAMLLNLVLAEGKRA